MSRRPYPWPAGVRLHAVELEQLPARLVAERLGVPVGTIYNWRRQRRLPARPAGSPPAPTPTPSAPPLPPMVTDPGPDVAEALDVSLYPFGLVPEARAELAEERARRRARGENA